MRLLKPLHFVIILAVGAGIVGAEDTTKVSADQSTINTGATLLRVANVLFLLIWCALVVATICLWVKPSRLQADQRVVSTYSYDQTLEPGFSQRLISDSRRRLSCATFHPSKDHLQRSQCH